MHPFTFSRANDTTQAIAIHKSNADVAYVAGGTDLLGLMKDRAHLPAQLVDINSIPGLARIQLMPDSSLRIGALARMSDVAADLDVRRHFPVISEALLLSASGQLRNMASIGGNLMQRTRCAYFRDSDGASCNKRQPGSGSSALHGHNRDHAIFGWSESCVATHPSDLAVALAALDASIRVRSADGERTIPLGQFHSLPGTTPHVDNVLRRGDLIVGVDVPPSAEARRSHYLKIRDRQSFEFALVSAAVAVAAAGRRIRSAKIAMGGVAHKPWRLPAAEAALRGVSLDEPAALRAALAGSFGDARPLDQNEFKVELAQRAVVRALRTVGARA
jgi:xanthine dehydrogenase YagS FAD-binding subunit